MERYTFDEIKNFKINDRFISRNMLYFVDTEPVYISSSNFYGDASDKVEWTAICQTEGDLLNQQHHFVIQNSYPQDAGNDILIFKETV